MVQKMLDGALVHPPRTHERQETSGETLWDLGLFIFYGAAPALAERAAKLLPPASDAWRSVDSSNALRPQGGTG